MANFKLFRSYFLVLIFSLLSSIKLHSEGTAQWMPTGMRAAQEMCLMLYNTTDGNGRLGTTGCDPDERIRISVSSNFANEVIYIGMNAFANTASHFRVLDPTGVQVYPTPAGTLQPVLSSGAGNTGEGYIATLTEARNGPEEVFGAGGFDAISISPTMAGDYYIEFNGANSTTFTNTGRHQISYFDVTVANTNGLPQGLGNHTAIDGRLNSFQWGLYNLLSGLGNQVTDAEYFLYQSDDSLVLSVLWDEVNPGGWDIAFTRNGVGTSGDYAEDRKSQPYTTVGKGSVVGEFPIFFNNPDPAIFPSATDLPTLNFLEYDRCSGSTCFLYSITKGGQVEVLIDLNENGVFDPGTADRLLVDNKPAGVHCLAWDDLDGLGDLVVAGQAQAVIKYQAGIFHMPLGDVEANENGFDRTLVRPLSFLVDADPGQIYYDHTEAGGPFGANDFDFDGCLTDCNIWDPSDGDQLYLNTWFSFSELRDTLIVTFNSCDKDEDGLSDVLDIDDDNDGIPDIVEMYNGDHDNDGVPDYEDAQFCTATFQGVNGWDCADGLPDPSADLDGDGIRNAIDSDFPGCGSTLGGACRNYDKDNDGIPNYLDRDSDNDGISDLIEIGGVDTDGDGVVDDLTDTDGDGLADDYDNDDTDGPSGSSPCAPQAGCLQGVSTNPLLDTDNDGITDNSRDTDGDSIADWLDLDSDNDGIPDVVEVNGTDTNGDGLADSFTDLDRDGFNDIVDGLICEDSTDIDTSTYILASSTGIDNGGNAQGQPNGTFAELYTLGDLMVLDFGVNLPVGTQYVLTWRRKATYGNTAFADMVIEESLSPGAGYSTNSFSPSTDENTDFVSTVVTAENAFRYLRIGLATNTDDDIDFDAAKYYYNEEQCVAGNPILISGIDTDADGEPNSYPADDADGDGVLDYLDLDADNDGIPDVVEAGGTDVNGDGRADNYADTDNDGFNDAVDGDVGNNGVSENFADVLIPTGVDTDNDGEPNSFPNGNLDGDNVYNYLDLDADDDGILDVIEAGGTDTNRDGQEDSYVDADGDGYNDNVDGDIDNSLVVGDDSDGGQQINATLLTGADTDGDGTPNSYPNGDFDGDEKYNFLDIDADNDGITDNTEGQSTAGYVAPANADDDNDGIDNAYDSDNASFGGANSSFVLSDIDVTANPNTPDYLDLDTDNDGKLDEIEGHDSNGNGLADSGSPANSGLSGGLTDIDNDGLLDGFDNNTVSTDPTNSGLQGTSHPNLSSPTSAERDWREIADIDQDGVTDEDDLDDDNDGIIDAVEAPGFDTDADGDGVPAYIDDNDSDDTIGNADGLAEAAFDQDNDGISNHLDLDSDGDGIPDNVEGQPTLGYVAFTSGTVSATGIPTEYSTDDLGIRPVDTDNDGTPDYLDTNSDNEGNNDTQEANLTLSGNDSDGDGLDDNVDETDALSNGLPDFTDPNGTINDPTTLPDSDNDLNQGGNVDFRDRSSATDFDGDGIDNLEDRDDDNDGIDDVLEGYKIIANGTTCTGNQFAFANPTLISGTAGQVNARYRFPTVKAGLDAIVTITQKSAGVTVNQIDNAAISSAQALQPVLTYAAGNNGDLTLGLSIQIVTAGTTTGVNQRTIGGFFRDIDGENFIREFYRFSNPIGVTVGNPTRILVSELGGGLVQFIADGSGSVVSGSDAINTSNPYRAFFQYQNANLINVTIGVKKNRNSSIQRFYSLLFDECNLANYNDPTHRFFNAPNTDGTAGGDYQDLDSDDDGCNDVNEAGFTDGTTNADDGELGNIIPAVVDANGLVTSGINGQGYTLPADLNNNGVFDFLEVGPDADGNGVSDGCDDFDNDGIPDNIDLDDDNDGIPDTVESPGFDTDNDGDGIPAWLDDDDNNAGVGNDDGEVEDEFDADNDGVADFQDLDADNDGIPDLVEAGGEDTNGDGKVDNINANGTLTTDTDRDGLDDLYDTNNGGTAISFPDTDGDGIDDTKDLDADNDGIPDVVEAGGTDVNGDGRADGFVDTDGDGFNDVVDGDVGNDGAENTANALTVTGTDTNSDGVPNSYPNDDPDGDGVPNFKDLDADNDGIPDVVEAGGTDQNGDGRADNYADADGDGFNDAVDGDPTNALAVGTDSDGTNSDNALIATGADGNGDGSPDTRPEGDFDQDGVYNFIDLDSDGDGILDVLEAGGTDSNTDGQEDAFIDSDGDGFNDNVDGDPDNSLTVGDDSNDSNTANATTLTGPDSDADGRPNSSPNDEFDGDNLYDFLDIDADNDGIVDNTEAQSTITYIAPAGNDADGDGIDDAYDSDDASFGGAGSGIVPVDTDSAEEPNSPDYKDVDSENDGISDLIEGHDTDGDELADAGSPANTGVPGGNADVDNDGLLDGFDNNTASTDATNGGLEGTSHPNITNPITTERDWREISDRDNDGISDAQDIDDDNDGILDEDECALTPKQSVVFAYTGSDQTYNVPAGATEIRAKIWGAGGRGDQQNGRGQGGAGGFTEFTIPVSSLTNSTLVVTVGQGGNSSTDGNRTYGNGGAGSAGTTNSFRNFGAGGGMSAISYSSLNEPNTAIDPSVPVSEIIAIAGGGGTMPAFSNPGTHAGEGGGTSGGDATDGNVGLNGLGGNQIAGGGSTNGDPGGYLYGGNSGPDKGAGGGGYYGGGSGSFISNNEGGGGGGSAFISNTTRYGQTLRGSVQTPPRNTDPDYIAGVGRGGNSNSGVGGNGLVIIEAIYLDCDDDGDGITNQFDLDSDNDGIPDIVEAGGVDANDDGRVDNINGDGTLIDDSDGNGFDDNVDPNNGGIALEDGDKDGDGLPNRIDLDADNDGIADIIEAGGVDSNGDGKADSPQDSDNDGWDNTFDSDNGGSVLPIADSDGDGNENYLDLDSDSDGITDNVEAQTTIAFDAPLGTDANNNGWDDRYDGNTTGTPITLSDNDGVGNPDYLDDDSDGDGFPDWIEGFDDDVDGDALNDLIARADVYEDANGNPLDYFTGDDADSDGIPDFLENSVNGIPNFLDPTTTFYLDFDGDGIIDLYDTEQGGVPSSTPDTDGDGEYDFRDTDDEISLPIELISFEAERFGNDVVLRWKTALEINNDYFIIERSNDGNLFEPILNQKGAGNSSIEVNYSDFDLNPNNGSNYYRLTQVDYDGKSKRFDDMIRQVDFSPSSGEKISIYPNPSGGELLYLEIEKAKVGEYTIELLSSRGKLISVKQINIEAETLKQEILQGLKLAKGVYYLKVQNKETSNSFKFVIQ